MLTLRNNRKISKLQQREKQKCRLADGAEIKTDDLWDKEKHINTRK
jgi:hypothetical protein